MSSTSTVRRFGTGKTYGRARESTASRAFDEVLTGKPTPIKAAPSYTKWGKTNFVAIRGEQKNKLDVIPDVGVKTEPVKEVKEEDPFSFDTEDKRKASPSKRVAAAQEVHRAVTKLPASRIVTVSEGNQNSPSQSLPAAIARPGRTYTRSQEGRTWTGLGGRSQLIMDQFVEVGKTVTTEEGMKVIYYSSQPHPRTTLSTPSSPSTAMLVSQQAEPSPSSSVEIPLVSSAEAVTPVSLTSLQDNTPKAGSSVDDGSDDDDDDDIFPATFRRQPLKTYTGEIITPVISAPDSPPPSKKRRMRSSRGRRNSRYTDPSLIEEYRRRYQATNVHKDHTAGMFNSTVVSSKEMRNQQGTTLVVVCKPKVDVAEKKDDVQTKYFKNVKKELDKADKNSILDFSESSDSQEEVKMEGGIEGKNLQTSLKKASSGSSPSLISLSDSTSSASTPTRNLRVRFADEVEVSPASSRQAVPSGGKRGRPPAAKSRNIGSSSQEAAAAGASFDRVQVENKDRSVGMRTRSSSRQYRIFKSRGPPPATPVSTEEIVQESADSPEMPQLTPELPAGSEGDEGDKSMVDNQTPPDIKNEHEVEMETQQPNDIAEVKSEETLSQESDRDGSHKNDVGVDETSNLRTKRDMTLIMEVSDDSQELPQELPPPVQEIQKEEVAAPAAPRRFFKSKKSSGAATSNLQRRVFEKSPSKASYNARSWQQEQESPDKEEGRAARNSRPVGPDDFEESGHSSQTMPKLKRTVHWSKDEDKDSYTSLHVNKKHKELYTVVHNVKQAYEVQESGETQDFMDDIEYLLDSLRDDQPSSIRTLSAVQLAGRCILPSFRMHLRAHGTVTKIFSLLHDACSDPALALSTAAMMFMLSRDRLNMDLDKESLHLILKLNEVDMPRAASISGKPVTNAGADGEEMCMSATAGINGEESVELEKCRRRVQELLEQLQRETNAKQIDLDFVSTGNLAMESLLSLTSRRAGEWFKEELRCLGGLDHFVETIYHCAAEIKDDVVRQLEPYMNSLKKLDRCLRVLENITFMNCDNQTYLTAYNNGRLISSTYRILKLCQQCLPSCPLQESGDIRNLREQPGWTVFSCLLAILRVLVNITHDNEFGSAKVGEEEGLLQTILSCMLSTQWCVPSDQRFDLLVLSLGLVVNLLEHCDKNRHHLTEMFVPVQAKEDDVPTEMNVIEALAQLFLQREAAAAQIEESGDTGKKGDTPNKSGQWHESDSGIEWITVSAENVKANDDQDTEQMQKRAELAVRSPEVSVAGSSSDKQIDGASILEDEETFTKALHKAGKHMENSIVASYVGLLLGCFVQGNEKYIEMVKKHLPGGSFQPMIHILRKFLGFMELTTAVGTADGNSISRVIETLEAC